METSEIVKRLLGRPVTPERALKVLHLLETPNQVADVMAICIPLLKPDEIAALGALTPSVVQAHFARYRR